VRRTSAVSFAFLLASCGPQHLKLTDGKCVRASIGDTIEGTATLHSYAGLGCIECGAYLTQKDCPDRLGFRTGTDAVDQEYDRITARRAGDDPNGPIERRVLVSGPIIPNGATGEPMLNADHLASAK
jgi:hypothetical protein